MFIDSHSHLNHEDFINNIDEYLSEAKSGNVDAFLCVGWDVISSINAIKIAEKYDNVYAAIGIHPSDVLKASIEDFSKIESLVNHPKVVAIGEIGLDFYWNKEQKDKDIQIDWFKRFLSLANRYHKPVVIHSRDAIDLTYQILKENIVESKGVIHCYQAGKDYVKRYVELGYYFGIGGVATYKNALSLKEAIKIIPIDRLLLETDAPYLAPSPYRGSKNHSKYIPLIASEIALLKGINVDDIEKCSTSNFYNLFNRSKK